MADAEAGRGQFLKIGPASNNLTTISGQALGLISFNISNTVASKEIAGTGTDAEHQFYGRNNRTANLETEWNSTTSGLLWNKSGTKIFFEWGPEGNASGDIKVTGSFLATVTDTLPTAGTGSFSATGPCDGAVTYGTY